MNHPNIPNGLTLTGRPLLLYPNVIPELQSRLAASYNKKAAKISDRLLRRSAIGAAAPIMTPQATTQLAISAAPQPAAAHNYVSIIHIDGPLLNKANYFGDTLCIDGYNRIEGELDAAFADPACGGILLDIDSPGGMVNGCFELTDKIRTYAQTKPIITHTPVLLCSAAYALASATTEIYADLTAYVGSIGVVYARYDRRAANDKQGFKITHITSGDQKTWGDPDTEISDDELASRQSEITLLADMFFDRVAAGRGMLKADIEALQAGTFLPAAALEKGLITGQANQDQALMRLTEMITDPTKFTPRQAAAQSPLASNPTLETTAAAAAQPSTINPIKESNMSTLKAARARATLTSNLSLFAMVMASNMAAADNFEDEDLKSAIDDETKKKVEKMDDDDVEALNEDDDIDKMEEEDEDLKAEDEETLKRKAEDEEDKTSARTAASYIAASALTSLSAKAAPKSPANPSDVDGAKISASTLSGIMALKSAKGREALAAQLAAGGMNIAAADAALKAAPAPSAHGNQAALKNIPSPKLGTKTLPNSDEQVSDLATALKNHQTKKAGR